MQILNVSNIDQDGQQYIWGHLEAEKVDERNLWSGFKAFCVELDHKKQTSTVNEYFYFKGVPRYIRTAKVYKKEIISETEIERVLKEVNLIK